MLFKAEEKEKPKEDELMKFDPEAFLSKVEKIIDTKVGGMSETFKKELDEMKTALTKDLDEVKKAQTKDPKEPDADDEDDKKKKKPSPEDVQKSMDAVHKQMADIKEMHAASIKKSEELAEEIKKIGNTVLSSPGATTRDVIDDDTTDIIKAEDKPKPWKGFLSGEKNPKVRAILGL